MIHTTHFGSLPDGRPVGKHTLRNTGGMSVEIIEWGAIVTSIRVPDRHGSLEDVVLGFDTLEPYLAIHPYFGAIVGRIAGRVAEGRLVIDGESLQLPCNDGEHHLHGGSGGLDKVLWHAQKCLDRPSGAERLRLHFRSPDGDQGYPGNLDIRTTYTLTETNEFIIETEGCSDKPTPLSLTHHSYFNLAGAGSGTIGNHELRIFSDRIVEMDDDLCPTGKVIPVAGCPGDFRKPRLLSDAIPHLHHRHGDLYLLDSAVPSGPGPAARVSHHASGRRLDVSTTETCLQLYTSSHFAKPIIGKSGKVYPRHAALCLECEGYSNATIHPGFSDILIRPGIPQRHTTIYSFTTF